MVTLLDPEDLNPSTKGISDALAEKKEVSVPEKKTPKQKAKEQTGIKRIQYASKSRTFI